MSESGGIQDLTMREAFYVAVEDWMARDETAVVVLADISAAAFARVNLRFPGRVLNVGIREQAAIGVAAGLSLEGYRPLVHTYAPFLIERPFEMVKDDLFHQGLTATLVSIGASYDEPAYGRTHQCPEDIALLDSLGTSEIFIPGHPEEVGPLLFRAISGSSVSYVRLSTAQNSLAHRCYGPKMVTIKQGKRAVVVAVGPMLDSVLRAGRGLDVTILYTTTIRPFDAIALRSAAEFSTDVVIVEPYLAGSSIPVVEHALRDVPHRILGLGVHDRDLHRYGTREEHDRAQGLDVEGIAASIRAFLGM
ncbi:MAG: transketolase family protein [Ferrimicrobium sp.]